jgi:hypothetical protein
MYAVPMTPKRIARTITLRPETDAFVTDYASYWMISRAKAIDHLIGLGRKLVQGKLPPDPPTTRKPIRRYDPTTDDDLEKEKMRSLERKLAKKQGRG